MATKKNTGRKKPPGKAVGHREDNVVELTLAPEVHVPEIPLPESVDVEPEVVTWWEDLWHSGLAQVIDGSDLDKLRRLAAYKNDWQKLRRVLDRTGEYVSTGSMGQATESPVVKQLHKVEKLIQDIEAQFGLDPLSRLRLGITLTDAAKSAKELNEIMGGTRDAHQGAAEEVDLEEFEASDN